MKNPNWKVLKSIEVYKSKWLRLRRDEIIRQDGSKGTYDVVEKPNFVIIIPRVGDKFYFIKQFRYPINEISLEFPGGLVNKGEDPKETALRELEEETGLKAGKILKLGFLWIATGSMSNGFSVFLAQECRKGRKKMDDSEVGMKTKILKAEEIREMIKDGKIRDSKTVSSFLLYSLNVDRI